MIDVNELGTLHAPDTMFMTVDMGDATSDSGEKLKLSIGLNGNPMVYNPKTRRYFSLSWQDVLDIAIARGIDKEHGVDEEQERANGHL